MNIGYGVCVFSCSSGYGVYMYILYLVSVSQTAAALLRMFPWTIGDEKKRVILIYLCPYGKRNMEKIKQYKSNVP